MRRRWHGGCVPGDGLQQPLPGGIELVPVIGMNGKEWYTCGQFRTDLGVADNTDAVIDGIALFLASPT